MSGKFNFIKTYLCLFFLVTVVLIIYLIPFFIPKAGAQLKAILWNGEEVEVMLGCQIDTDTIKVGSQFRARVKGDVTKGDDTYIYKGDPVFATVDSVKKQGCYGRGAKLVIRFDSTMSTGGTFIPLEGKWRDKGKGRKTWAYIFFFLGWAIKGKNVRTAADDSCVTKVNVPDPPGYIEIEYIQFKS